VSVLKYFKSIKSREVRLAWLVALAADAIQIFGLPFFSEGALSPVDDALDMIVAVVLVKLLGWNWAFLPTLLAELVPGLDLFPTWTAAVWYVSHQLGEGEETPEPLAIGEPEILPPNPASQQRS